MITIRLEHDGDHAAIRSVNRQAFGQRGESDIVDRLRGAPDVTSWVALANELVVGHLLMSPVSIQHADGTTEGFGLGPMAVVPAHQNAGIGTRLIEHSIAEAGAAGWPFVVVLGHPRYYPRCGFVPASQHGVRSEWEGVPDDAFMILPLPDGDARKLAGVARYRPEFGEVT